MDNKTITISTAPRLAGMLLAFVFLLAGQMLFAQSKQVTGVVRRHRRNCHRCQRS